jgi:hypothetical protein
VLEKFGGDSVGEVRRNVAAYLATLGDTLPMSADPLAVVPATVSPAAAS